MPTAAKLIKLDENSVLDDRKYDVCLQQVFSWLTIVDRYRVREVCKRWKEISEMPWEDMRRLNCYYSWSNPATFLPEITLTRLAKVLSLCGNHLRHLDFSGNYPAICCQSIKFDADDNFFSILSTYCPNLDILDIYILKPTPQGIAYMAENYNNIRDVRIHDFYSQCDESLSLFFKKARCLRAITLYNYGKKDKCLLDLPIEMLGEIHLGNIYDESVGQIVSVLEKCHYLHSFSVKDMKLKKSNLTGITKALTLHASTLKRLILSADIISPSALKSSHFLEFKNLKVLELSVNNKLDDKLLEIIGETSRQLKSVKFTMSEKVTDRGLKALPNLKQIDLRGLPMVKGQFLSEMSNLKRVALSHCNIIDRSLHILLDTAKNLQLFEFKSFKYHDIKEFALHALDYAKERKTSIPLEIVLDLDGKVKELKRDLLHVRNAE